MRFRTYFYFSWLLAAFIEPVWSQNASFTSVLGMPEHYTNPRDYEGEEANAFILKKSSYDKVNPWIVISDRSDNKTYSRPDESASVMKQLDFRSVYWVVREEGEWIQIVKIYVALNALKIKPGAKVDDYGWIKKSNVVLWNKSLMHPENGIHLKSLLLYSSKSVAHNKGGDWGKKIKLYSGPGETYPQEKQRYLYEFLFVLKKQNGWLLLASDNSINHRAIDATILGWVPSENQAPWNTRLALEPNVLPEAYEERKKNEKLKVRVFDLSTDANNYRHTGSLNNVLITYDPVGAPAKELDKSGYRFKGNKMRLPALESTPNYFKTGVLGGLGGLTEKNTQITDLIQTEYSQMKNASANFNISFLIEARLEMRPFKEQIKQALQVLKNKISDDGINIKYSVSFYRHAKLDGSEPYFKIKKNLNSINQVIEQINSAEFINEESAEVGALNYAINQAIIKSGFGENETNVLFVIANNPDFSTDMVLASRCKGCTEKCSVDSLAVQMVKNQLNLAVMNPSSSDEFNMNNFRDLVEDMLLEKAKGLYEDNRTLGDQLKKFLKLDFPEVKSIGTSSYVKGQYLSLFRGHQPEGTIEASGFESVMKSSLDTILSARSKYIHFLDQILFRGSSIAEALDEDPAVGDFAPIIVDKLNNLIRSSGNVASPEVIQTLINRKVKIYYEGYVSRRGPGAKYDALSPVLFFPQAELHGYIEELEKLTTLENRPLPEMQLGLEEALKNMFQRYTGVSKKKIPKDLDLNDLSKALVGNGFDFDRPDNFKINELTSRNMKPETVRSFIANLSAKAQFLTDLLNKQSVNRDYIYTTDSGETYFWVPFDKTF